MARACVLVYRLQGPSSLGRLVLGVRWPFRAVVRRARPDDLERTSYNDSPTASHSIDETIRIRCVRVVPKLDGPFRQFSVAAAQRQGIA
ncbi:hypothetical protein Enr13x_15840 [Stieleria neptunia]|uniref:Uncharacterized protein n=1 Tax=Stieleria neptunia TaxID=2527979 RepID=A0A518HLK9_9BACT|nr:hypothetical protein Enr13x_15840 [Stieleria neptunia]